MESFSSLLDQFQSSQRVVSNENKKLSELKMKLLKKMIHDGINFVTCSGYVLHLKKKTTAVGRGHEFLPSDLKIYNSSQWKAANHHHRQEKQEQQQLLAEKQKQNQSQKNRHLRPVENPLKRKESFSEILAKELLAKEKQQQQQQHASHLAKRSSGTNSNVHIQETKAVAVPIIKNNVVQSAGTTSRQQHDSRKHVSHHEQNLKPARRPSGNVVLVDNPHEHFQLNQLNQLNHQNQLNHHHPHQQLLAEKQQQQNHHHFQLKQPNQQQQCQHQHFNKTRQNLNKNDNNDFESKYPVNTNQTMMIKEQLFSDRK